MCELFLWWVFKLVLLLVDCVLLYVCIVECFDVMLVVGFFDEVCVFKVCGDLYVDLLVICVVGYW